MLFWVELVGFCSGMWAANMYEDPTVRLTAIGAVTLATVVLHKCIVEREHNDHWMV